ncbi:MAG: DotA/TraY family protein [Gammaproteobacteria bacterium]|jgi:hypothetical protein
MMKKFSLLKKAVIQVGLFFGTIVFSASAFADGAVPINIPSFFTIAHKDVSVGILQSIFGHITGLFDGATPGILNTMFRQFNLAIMILSLFVIVYVVIISIINTAHQGEFLGKKLDSMWVPLRLLVGFCLVVPFPCGYSAIQWIMMWVVLQGVGAADSLWNSVCKYVSNSDNTLMSASMNQGQYSTNSMNKSHDLLKVLVSMHRYQGFFEKATFDDGKNIGYKFYCNFGPHTEYMVGSIKWPNPDSEESAAISRGMYNMVQSLDKTAQQIIDKRFPTDVNGNVDEPNPLLTTLGYLQSQYLDALEKKQEQHEDENQSKPKDKFWNDASTGGWMTAGMYYYDIANRNNDASTASTDIMGENVQLDKTASYVDDQNSDDATYVKSIYDDATGADFFDSNISGDPSGAGGFSQFLTKNLLEPILKGVVVGDATSVDPLIFIQMLGGFILSIIIKVWAIIMIGLAALAGVLGAFSYLTPAISAVYHVMVLFVLPIFMLLATLFGAAVFMAFYIPMIPYIVFTFAAIGWMIAVFETMLAAPMVAIGLADPHAQHEVLGRAEPALQMLANVFLRPSLMIFGLIGGMILAKAAVKLVYKTFFVLSIKVLFASWWHAIIQASPIGDWAAMNGNSKITTIIITAVVADLGGFGTSLIVGIIGLVVMLCMLVLIDMAIINRCFSLIHIVPDRILSWLGWQAQFGQYSQAPEQEIKQGFKSAAGALGKFGQQGLEGVKKTSDSFVSYSAGRGRQAEDWGHNKGIKHLFGGKSGKSNGTGGTDGEGGSGAQ